MRSTDFQPLRCQAVKTDNDFKHVDIYRNVCNYNVSYYQVRSKAGKVLFNADRFEDAEKFALKHDFEKEKSKPPIDPQLAKLDAMFAEINKTFEDENNTDPE